ncbi:3-oxoacyl-ACP synthase, partial [Vibrio sp. 10N.261.46.E11]
PIVSKPIASNSSAADLPQGLQTLQHILLGTQHWTIAGKHQNWSWVNNAQTGALK